MIQLVGTQKLNEEYKRKKRKITKKRETIALIKENSLFLSRHVEQPKR